MAIGSVVVATTPHVRVLSTRHLASFCSACAAPGRTGSPLQRCTKCKVVWYCGSVCVLLLTPNRERRLRSDRVRGIKACQNADWTMHKRECSAIVRWAESVPPPSSSASSSSDSTAASVASSIPSDAIRCLARVVWTRRLAGNESVLVSSPLILIPPTIIW